jgi:hypothetical protein
VFGFAPGASWVHQHRTHRLIGHSDVRPGSARVHRVTVASEDDTRVALSISSVKLKQLEVDTDPANAVIAANIMKRDCLSKGERPRPRCAISWIRELVLERHVASGASRARRFGKGHARR